MSAARQALQQIQLDLNGHRGTTFGHLPVLECIQTGRPYVVQGGRSCRYELPTVLDVRTERFEFTVAGVAVLRAELIGLGLLGCRPARSGRQTPPISITSEETSAPSIIGPSVWEWLRNPAV